MTRRAGLPRLALGANASAEAPARFEALYPAFAETTGWRAKGEYEDMPPEEERLLAAFYAPYNEALYRYLGVDLGWQKEGEERGRG